MRLLRPALVVSAILLGAGGCHSQGHPQSPSEKKSPAKVSPLPSEANLADVVLTAKAFERLGITLATVEHREVSQSRQLGGEVTIPPGEVAVVAAPVAGTIELPDKGPLPRPGSRVEKGREVFRFVPLLTPERFVPTPAERAQIAGAEASLISMQMAADGDVKQFTEEVAAAEVALDRAKLLQKDRVGSGRAVDEAKAQLSIAEARLKVAQERKAVLDRLSSDIEGGQARPVSITAPIDGIMRSLPVTLGQTVNAGTTLFEVVNLDEVWVRVPVYVGLLNELDLEADAEISSFGSHGRPSPMTSRPVNAPPAADPLASTVDLFYALPNTDKQHRPGERVSVSIPLQGVTESLVVPSKSVLYDIHGGTWVYVQIEELTFRRSRVVLSRTTDNLAVLDAGPDVGTKVVVDGAAELFGTEFGTGK